MLHPSYSELMEYLNDNSDIDNKVTSRYTVVIAAAKRARQLTDMSIADTGCSVDKAVSIAVNELFTGKVKIRMPILDIDDQVNLGTVVENQFSEA